MLGRLEACYFAADQFGTWERLARVLSATAEQHCQGWQVRVTQIAPIALNHRLGARTLIRNTQKLEHWRQVVEASADGDRLLLIDADTMIVRPLDPVWDLDFDIAYTTKKWDYPINGGVVFLRISPVVKKFVNQWAEENSRMLHDPDFHLPWRRKFAGINQASFGYLVTEHRPPDVKFMELPCREWNCEDSAWAAFDRNVTRIVHVKSALRLACLESQPIPPELADLTARWKSIDRAAGRLTRSA